MNPLSALRNWVDRRRMAALMRIGPAGSARLHAPDRSVHRGPQQDFVHVHTRHDDGEEVYLMARHPVQRAPLQIKFQFLIMVAFTMVSGSWLLYGFALLLIRLAHYVGQALP